MAHRVWIVWKLQAEPRVEVDRAAQIGHDHPDHIQLGHGEIIAPGGRCLLRQCDTDSMQRGRYGSLAAVLVAVAASAYSMAEPASAGARVATHALTPAQLASDLRNAEWLTRVPVDLQPPLADARSASPGVSTNGCGLGHAGVWKKPCISGDPKSHTSVVLFGDSHAAMWFPALNLISKQHHWRLIDLIKSGCPPVEVSIAAWFLDGAPYAECPQWRANALAHIAALHPALVIVTWARWLEEPEARPLPGVPTGYGTAWQDGLAATFRSLRRAAGRVIFISDIPTLSQSAPLCLSQHKLDVQACTPTRSAAISLATVKAQELSLAAQERVSSIDPTPWFCTQTRCPLIADNLLIYQDNSHMTRQWAQFIAPVLADSILPIMRSG